MNPYSGIIKLTNNISEQKSSSNLIILFVFFKRPKFDTNQFSFSRHCFHISPGSSWMIILSLLYFHQNDLQIFNFCCYSKRWKQFEVGHSYVSQPQQCWNDVSSVNHYIE
eukprot:UN05072